MNDAKIKEVVVYTIKASSETEVDFVQKVVRDCLTNCDGFVSVESLRGAKDALQLVDIVSWKTLKHAEKAKPQFEQHASFPELARHVADMKFSGHFSIN